MILVASSVWEERIPSFILVVSMSVYAIGCPELRRGESSKASVVLHQNDEVALAAGSLVVCHRSLTLEPQVCLS